MALPRQSHTIDSLREHWEKSYELFRDPTQPPPVYAHALYTNNRDAIGCLINLMMFTVTTREQALELFTQLDGRTTFRRWSEDLDATVAHDRYGKPDGPHLFSFEVHRILLTLWLTQQHDLAKKCFGILRERISGIKKAGRGVEYDLHLAQALSTFEQRMFFPIPEPAKGYRRDQKHLAALFVLMNAIVNHHDIPSAIELVDKEFSASNKGKRSPKGYDLNDGEHRLIQPWNFNKFCVLQFASDRFDLELDSL